MIKNASGCTDSSAKVVDVDTADARFTYSFKGTSVDFTPNISGMKLYSWDYDDGSSGDSIEKPVHTFPTSNKYRVTLRVSTQAGCKATWSDSVSAVYTASLSEVKGNMSLTVYPNPFKETANIRYSLDQAADIKIEIFALDGKRLANLVNTRQEPGNYTLQFTPSEYNISAAGLFIIRMSVNESVLRKTIIMVH